MTWISCLDEMPQNAVMVLGWVRKHQVCKVVVRSRLNYGASEPRYEWIGDEVDGDEGTLAERLPDEAVSHWCHLPNAPGTE
jgi:hypothetical protein